MSVVKRNLTFIFSSPGRKSWELMPCHSIRRPSGVNYFL